MHLFPTTPSLSSSVGRAQGWKLWGRWFEPNLRHVMTRLFFAKTLLNIPYIFLKNNQFRTKNVALLVTDATLYYIALHLKFASSERSTQLVELFAYENSLTLSTTSSWAPASNPLVVYQFHNLFTQTRLFLFATSSKSNSVTTPKSLGELFFSATWLEREAGEMHGICFEGKKDLRNLMLQYGDSSAPFRKSYPSIGLKETFYDSVTDTLSIVPVSIQV